MSTVSAIDLEDGLTRGVIAVVALALVACTAFSSISLGATQGVHVASSSSVCWASLSFMVIILCAWFTLNSTDLENTPVKDLIKDLTEILQPTPKLTWDWPTDGPAPSEFVLHDQVQYVGKTLKTLKNATVKECTEACHKDPLCTHFQRKRPPTYWSAEHVKQLKIDCITKDRVAAWVDRIGGNTSYMPECINKKCGDGFQENVVTYTHPDRTDTDGYTSATAVLKEWDKMGSGKCDAECIETSVLDWVGTVGFALPMINIPASFAKGFKWVVHPIVKGVSRVSVGVGFYQIGAAIHSIITNKDLAPLLADEETKKSAFVYDNIPVDQKDQLLKGMTCIMRKCATYEGLNTSGVFSGGYVSNQGVGFGGSDRRAKTDISQADLRRCYDVVQKLTLHMFAWDKGHFPHIHDRRQLGFMAQDVKDIFPKSVVIENKHGLADFHSLNPDQLYKCLFGAVQHMQTEMESMKKEIVQLKLKCEEGTKKESLRFVGHARHRHHCAGFIRARRRNHRLAETRENVG
jgi:hypothetical protein